MNAYLPYGLNQNNELVYIDQVARGRTLLRCPYCGVNLLAKKGDVMAAHFAHDGKTCRQTSRNNPAFELPAYDSFNLKLSPKVLHGLRMFHAKANDYDYQRPEADEDKFDDTDYDGLLEHHGLIKSFRTRYGNERYELTHKGKIPFGDLSLDLFNKFHEGQLRARHSTLTRTAIEKEKAGGSVHAALTDLRIYQAQLRRVLKASLYFIEVQTEQKVLHKIGVTARDIDERLAEIRADLLPHFGEVKLKVLGTWLHRGTTEMYFKHRYRNYQHRVDTLTEYFAFDDVKPVLRDLRRMKAKTLDETESILLFGDEDNPLMIGRFYVGAMWNKV